jgi:hypothetical protein
MLAVSEVSSILTRSSYRFRIASSRDGSAALESAAVTGKDDDAMLAMISSARVMACGGRSVVACMETVLGATAGDGSVSIRPDSSPDRRDEEEACGDDIASSIVP